MSRILRGGAAGDDDERAVQLAALAAAQARDGALVDPQKAADLLKFSSNVHLNSRRLLSNAEEERNNNKEPKASAKRRAFNLTLNETTNDSSMELVQINGTWHLIDLNVCYRMMYAASSDNTTVYLNQTHSKKINDELTRWFERHAKHGYNGLFKETHEQPNVERHPSLLRNLNRLNNLPSRSNEAERTIREGNSGGGADVPTSASYPVSIYDTQTKRYEKFSQSVRKRNDTFYYISFRRDHIIFPSLAQNRTQRPRMTLLMPALLNNDAHLNDSSKGTINQVAFLQIDCDVTDTRLLFVDKNDIPLDYMRILQDNIKYQSADSSYDSNNFY